MSITNININREEILDPHYRYKMPKVSLKIEGRQKNTVVGNLEDIAKSLERDEKEILKYIGYAICSQAKMKKDKAIINGQHQQNTVQNIIYDYIDHFVLCKNCVNPETGYHLNIRKSGNKLKMRCKACSKKSKIGEHKLVKYIVKKLMV